MPDTFNIPEQPGPSEPVSIVDAPEAVDPEAPFGRLGNGRPRKTPQKKAAAGRRSAAAPKASTPRGGSRKAAGAPDFRPVVQEAMSLLSIPLMGLGRLNRAFLSDAATLQVNAEAVSHAVNECAKINPSIERMLTTSAPAVPYVLLGSALFNMGVQIAANHGKTVPGVKVHDPEELAAGMERQMRVAAEQQAAAEQQQAAPQHEYAA